MTRRRFLVPLLAATLLCGCQSEKAKHKASLEDVAAELRPMVPQGVIVLVEDAQIVLLTPKGDRFLYETSDVWDAKDSAREALLLAEQAGLSQALAQGAAQAPEAGGDAPGSDFAAAAGDLSRETHLIKANVLVEEARAAWSKGDAATALAKAQEAGRIRRELLGDGHPQVEEVKRMVQAAQERLGAGGPSPGP